MHCCVFDFLCDSVKVVHSVHSHHAVYADYQRLFCVKFDAVVKFDESVHNSLDDLSEDVVCRLGVLLEASGSSFGAS